MTMIALLGLVIVLFAGGVFIGLQILASIKGPKFTGLILPVLHIFIGLMIMYTIPMVTNGSPRIMNIGIPFLGFVEVVYLGIFFIGLTVKKKADERVS